MLQKASRRKILYTLATAIVLLVKSPTGLLARPGHGGGSGGGVPMSRLRTIGFENGVVGANSVAPGDSVGEGNLTSAFSASASVDTSIFRTGHASISITVSGAASSNTAEVLFTLVDNSNNSLAISGRTFYARGYFRFVTMPTQTVGILYYGQSATSQVSARVTSAGKLALFNNVGAVQIGSDSTTTLVAGQWYRVELSFELNTVNNTFSSELRLDGTTVASATNTPQVGGALTNNVRMGFPNTSPGANITVNIDDVAINSSDGVSQNSFPGEGSVVLLLPIGDSAIGGWTGGGGGTTNLFDAVDNTPPVGKNIAAPETDAIQISNIVSSATDNYDAVMQSYASAGVPSNATVTVVQGLCEAGEGTATGTKNGAVQVVSNPAQAVEDSFIYGLDITNCGFWAQGWEAAWTTAQVNPTVALFTSPVFRVGKRTATVREVNVCFMGLEVEYTTPTLVSGTAHRLALTGVGS